MCYIRSLSLSLSGEKERSVYVYTDDEIICIFPRGGHARVLYAIYIRTSGILYIYEYCVFDVTISYSRERAMLMIIRLFIETHTTKYI